MAGFFADDGGSRSSSAGQLQPRNSRIPFRDVPMSWSSMARICSEADIFEAARTTKDPRKLYVPIFFGRK